MLKEYRSQIYEMLLQRKEAAIHSYVSRPGLSEYVKW